MEDAAQDSSRTLQYVKVYRFMGSDLGLSGVDLLVYARVFGFWAAGKPFYESRTKTAGFFGTTKRSVITSFNKLQAQGLVVEVKLPAGMEQLKTRAYSICEEMVVGLYEGERVMQTASHTASAMGEKSSPISGLTSEVASPATDEVSSLMAVKDVHPIQKVNNQFYKE